MVKKVKALTTADADADANADADVSIDSQRRGLFADFLSLSVFAKNRHYIFFFFYFFQLFEAVDRDLDGLDGTDRSMVGQKKL